MQLITLSGATDFDGWRSAARSLLARAVPPDQIEWTTAGEAGGLFARDDDDADRHARSKTQPEFRVPAVFIDLCRSTSLHTDSDRFALLYRLLTELDDTTKIMITVHPSYLLRVPEADQPREYARFVADLTKTVPFLG